MALRAWMLANIPDEQRPTATEPPEDQALWLEMDLRWVRFLRLSRFELDHLRRIVDAVRRDRERGHTVYPAPEDVHRWSRLCGPEDVHVVIIGQDPYHDGSANGLAFATTGDRIPPSLRNIFKELVRSVPGFEMPGSGCLDGWCEQGVLLLNSVFTVLRGRPGSHEHLGWQTLCDALIRQLSERREHLVFMLWGKLAQEKEYLIHPTRHLILRSCHPSPRVTSTSFVGNDHFRRANEYLLTHGSPAIRWQQLTGSGGGSDRGGHSHSDTLATTT
ncbi:T114 [Tupaiid betaherpesvirus 1]|uniref:T114 n=1 Tax=Tupaiid herpesvirus 1 (strain 1) TaxID=10397 RepID=Q91TI7_TUHV1|nr:T114 [Tupaiid betaherpesvirus 1]AAK57160.1 T114 [Tupaiid betaherpesvirus 1]